MSASTVARVCPKTGLYLVAATGQDGWRVAQERYTRSGGILAVRANEHIGPLPPEVPDQRDRFDTIGMTTAEYMAQIRAEAEINGRERPWAVNAAWQMSRSLHRVAMPATGWWVQIEDKNTLNRLGADLAKPLRDAGVPMLTLAGTTSEHRAVTTLLAEHVRGQTLFDSSRPLGIEFSSKTGYGACWAWWNRRADDGLTPGENDPKTVEDDNVDGSARIPPLRGTLHRGPNGDTCAD